MQTLKSPILVMVIFLIFPLHCSFAQVTIDTSAIPIFWELTDTLSADKTPSDALWDKFAQHPAYQQIEKSGNRVSYLKRVLPKVFMPSKKEELELLLNGKESPYQYFALHLVDIQSARQSLTKYLRNTDFNAYTTAYKRSLNYLPKDIKKKNIELTIYLALFEDNGFGGKVITMDLLHLYRGTKAENADFFAHEFHHALRMKSKANQLYAPETSDYYPIIQALNKLPLEGVASLLDKKKYFQAAYFTDTLNMDKGQRETVEEFRQLVHLAPENLKEIDVILKSKIEIQEKGKKIFQQLPWGGHAIGYYMANAIEKEFGKKQLIKAQYSCLEFLFLYQEAAKQNQELFSFSENTLTFLKQVK